MFIPRELGMHTCEKCSENLVDSNFLSCGISLNTENKWKIYFQYDCPHCGLKNGAWVFKPQEDELPGDLFRQVADLLDQELAQDSHRKEIEK